MNKKEVITRVSGISEVDENDCRKVLDAFEQTLSDELSNSGGARNAFGKVYKMMSFIRNKQEYRYKY